MALPELICNSPVPGVREQLTTLSEALTEVATTLKLAAKLPAALEGPGQCRLVIDHEILLCTATSETTVTVLERGAEGSTKAAHESGAKVYCLLTKGALDARYPVLNSSGQISESVLPAGVVLLTGEQTITGRKNFETPQPAEVSGLFGTGSVRPIFVKSGPGGNTSTATTGTGGSSAPVILESGPGGEAKLAKTTSTGGGSGAIQFSIGEPGKGGITGGEKGVGGGAGQFSFSGREGGGAIAETTVSNKGGLGSKWTGQSGPGGKAENSLGTNTGANSGLVTLACGPGGAAKGGLKAIGGNSPGILIETGSGGAGTGASETNTPGKGGPLLILLSAGGGGSESLSGPLEVRYKEAAGAIRFYIHPEGNVGVGNNATPAYKLDVREGDIAANTTGNGFRVKEGANAKMGTATLVAGTVVVATTAVTANSRIFLTINEGGLLNVGVPYEAERTAGTSFTIKSSNALDTSTVAWLIMEPA